MDIPNKDQFQPSSDTLKFWLATRKPNLHVAGVDLPGFFSDTDSNKDYNWFVFALIGELLGFILTIYGGMRSGGVFLIIAIFAVVAFIIVDLTFAKLLHSDEAEKCELRSKKLCVDDSSITSITKIDLELNKGKLKKYFFKGFIIFIAVAKSFGVVALGVFNAFSIYIPLFVIFFLIAYAHIYHTGFHLAYRKAVSQRDKDHKVFKQGNGYHSLDLQQNFQTMKELAFNNGTNIIEHHPHKVVSLANNSKDKFSYEIQSKGVLTDTDILALIAKQDKINKIELFKACRELQFIILNSQQRIDIN